MNTSRLKSFAVEARNTLKQGVMNRILSLGFDRNGNIVLEPKKYDDGAVFMSETVSLDFYNKWVNLRDRIQWHGLRVVLEEAAYTWFNRLMSIRIMQHNGLIDPVLDYRSENVRLPILITNAQAGNIPTMPAADRDRLRELLNDPMRTAEQFAILITAFCHNTPIINSCFGKIADYTELLLPNDILEANGFLDRLNNTDFITEEDYKSPELIGWLYQFYISERKDEVFAKKGKYDPDEIPAATQIFTPNWIVKYMVQNTVGRIYLDNNPYEDELKANWKYLIENDQQDEKLEINDLVELKVADLACGSGHILNECFDLLLDLYVNEGYNRRQAIENILTNNITGIDLDTRAKQLATFALLLKACQKDKSFANGNILPHILDMPEPIHQVKFGLSNGNEATIKNDVGYELSIMDHALTEYFVTINKERLTEIRNALFLFVHCDSLGSIMKFDISDITRYAIEKMTAEWRDKQNRGDTLPVNVKRLMPYFDVMLALTQKYSALVMNPPYLECGNMDSILSSYCSSEYKEGKNDLFSVFMLLAVNRLCDNGKFGMINMDTWTYKSSFSGIRQLFIDNFNIDSLLHLGARTFEELSGEVVQNVAFIITNHKPFKKGAFLSLGKYPNCEDKKNGFLESYGKFHRINQVRFDRIPNQAISIVSDKMLEALSTTALLGSFGVSKQGLATGNNDLFVRYWYEVIFDKLGLGLSSTEKALESGYKWFPYNKGGARRKWYGNQELVVNWENDGFEIKHFTDAKGKLRSRPQNTNFYFRPSISWGLISGPFFRFFPMGSIYDIQGMSYFTNNDMSPIDMISWLNSCVFRALGKSVNPREQYQAGDLLKLPVCEKYHPEISKTCISIAKEDWDAHETSWDFQSNELIAIDEKTYNEIVNDFCDFNHCLIDEEMTRPESLEWRMKWYIMKWQTKFDRLHANEEELNRQFIEIYGLQDELTPDVPFDEVTILQQGEISIEDNEVVWHDEAIIKQLISYAVGCWMGRYRLDKPGLHIAHPDTSREEIAPYEYNGEQFEIDDDGIIPLMPKDCIFPDNAAQRLADFVRQVFGSLTQVENLNFIEEALGKSIEQYFIKDFWKDHKKMYQNRPIYWLFSSKKGAFQCLAYMHRMDAYTVERVRQKYLLPHMEDLRKRIGELAERAASLNNQERKTLESLGKQLEECMEYHDRLHPIADKQIAFDLDDGVLVNYAKFGNILAKIK